jgi:hypothetical protein
MNVAETERVQTCSSSPVMANAVNSFCERLVA